MPVMAIEKIWGNVGGKKEKKKGHGEGKDKAPLNFGVKKKEGNGKSSKGDR